MKTLILSLVSLVAFASSASAKVTVLSGLDVRVGASLVKADLVAQSVSRDAGRIMLVGPRLVLANGMKVDFAIPAGRHFPADRFVCSKIAPQARNAGYTGQHPDAAGYPDGAIINDRGEIEVVSHRQGGLYFYIWNIDCAG